MAEKHSTTEPSWQPLAQKLSGLIRRSSTRSKKSPVTTSEKSSIFRFKRQRRLPSPESAPEIKPLEIDLKLLEGTRLGDGWLETDIPDGDHVQSEQPCSARTCSMTPKGDLFRHTSVFDSPLSSYSGQLARPSSQKYGITSRRPFSMVETRNIMDSHTSTDLTSICNTQTVGSILDRGRPIEPQHFMTGPFLRKSDSRDNSTFEKAATPTDQPLNASQYNGGCRSSVVIKQNILPQGRPAKNSDPDRRHSMFAVVTPPPSGISATASTTPTMRNGSAMSVDRIQAWQNSISSAPTSAAAALSSAVPLQSDIPVRNLSTRGVSNRLAWIRELEEKKSSTTNSELRILNKQPGSVSDKLAIFENKQMQATSYIARLPLVTRSNSATSRLSWAGLESASSANGNIIATPRTSIDTTRSNYRPSSVMSYYNDTFCEKMESVVGGQAAGKDVSGLEKKRSITTRFVPVKSETGEQKPQSFVTDVDPSITELHPADEKSNTVLSPKGLVKSDEKAHQSQEDMVAIIIEAENT